MSEITQPLPSQQMTTPNTNQFSQALNEQPVCLFVQPFSGIILTDSTCVERNLTNP